MSATTAGWGIASVLAIIALFYFAGWINKDGWS